MEKYFTVTPEMVATLDQANKYLEQQTKIIARINVEKDVCVSSMAEALFDQLSIVTKTFREGLENEIPAEQLEDMYTEIIRLSDCIKNMYKIEICCKTIPISYLTKNHIRILTIPSLVM